jgi:hypothetical protein
MKIQLTILAICLTIFSYGQQTREFNIEYSKQQLNLYPEYSEKIVAFYVDEIDNSTLNSITEELLSIKGVFEINYEERSKSIFIYYIDKFSTDKFKYILDNYGVYIGLNSDRFVAPTDSKLK